MMRNLHAVMAGLMPVIHGVVTRVKTWMPGMKLGMTICAGALCAAIAAAPAAAQDKPTVSGYLNQGFDIIHIEGGGGQFLFFFLRKERTVVWCSVLLQSGETSSCRTVK
jgi:hypothetical protein